MLSAIKEYLPLIVWILVIIASIWVMYKSKKDDDGKFEHEDDEQQKEKPDKTIVRYNGWGIPESHEN